MILSLLAMTTIAAAPRLQIAAIDGTSGRDETHIYLLQQQHQKIGLIVVAADGKCHAGASISFQYTDCQAVNKNEVASARWYLVVPKARDYDNVRYCDGKSIRSGCHDPVQYETEELVSLRGQLEFDVHVVSQLSTLGTHLIIAKISWEGKLLAAPSVAASRVDDQIVTSVFRLVVRSGDNYTGYLSELLGVPFVLGPVYLPGRGHQTDLQLAADCVALVIYGRRRLGETVPYMAPPALHKRMTRIGAARELMSDKGMVSYKGQVRIGDVLYFGFQTAVIYDGLSDDGSIQPATRVIHSYHRAAEIVRIDQLPYRFSPVEVLRWPNSGSIE